MLETLQTVAATLISTGGVVMIGWFTYRSTRKKDKVQAVISQEANAITFSAQLMGRLDKLEQEIANVRSDLDKVTRTFRISMNYIERLWQWAKSGSRPPIPDIPESLYEHLDPSLINEHHRAQREHNEGVSS